MKNVAFGTANISLMAETNLTEEEFYIKCHPENIINQKLTLTDVNGNVHIVDIPFFLELMWDSFENNKEATELHLSDLEKVEQ